MKLEDNCSWKESYDKFRQCIIKQRHHLANKDPYSQGYMVFQVVMYRCESWTIKKAEHQRIDVFKLWCQRRLLRATWTARRSNQSVLKEINPEYSLEELMLKLKLQYFRYLMQRAYSSGKTEGRRRRGWQRRGWLGGIADSMDMSLSKLWELLKDREVWHAALHEAAKSQTQRGNWTTSNVPLVRKNATQI